MKRIALAFGLALVLATAPAAAQTGFRAAVGFAIPRPYVSGVLVVGRPYPFYRAPAVVVVPLPRPYFHRAPFLLVGRPFHARHRHRRDFDCDDDD